MICPTPSYFCANFAGQSQNRIVTVLKSVSCVVHGVSWTNFGQDPKKVAGQRYKQDNTFFFAFLATLRETSFSHAKTQSPQRYAENLLIETEKKSRDSGTAAFSKQMNLFVQKS